MMETQDEVSPRKRGMTAMRLTLAAGVPQRFILEGDWVHGFDAPAGVNDLTARFDQSEKVPIPKGVGFRRYYREIELESATGGAFVVMAGFGTVLDSRSTANVNVSATIASGASLDDGGDVSVPNNTATQLLAQDTGRSYALIVNPSSNSATFRVGSSGVTMSKGAILEPGSSIALSTTAAVWAIQNSGSPATLSASAVKV